MVTTKAPTTLEWVDTEETIIKVYHTSTSIFNFYINNRFVFTKEFNTDGSTEINLSEYDYTVSGINVLFSEGYACNIFCYDVKSPSNHNLLFKRNRNSNLFYGFVYSIKERISREIIKHKFDTDSHPLLTKSIALLNSTVSNVLVSEDVVDNLTSTDTDKPLSANQGRLLSESVDSKADNTHNHGLIESDGYVSLPVDKFAGVGYVLRAEVPDKSGRSRISANVLNTGNLVQRGALEAINTQNGDTQEVINTQIDSTIEYILGRFADHYDQIAINTVGITNVDGRVNNIESNTITLTASFEDGSSKEYVVYGKEKTT